CGTQLEGLRLLCARDVERAAEERLGFRAARGIGGEEQLALLAVQDRVDEVLARSSGHGEPGLDRPEGIRVLPRRALAVRETREDPRNPTPVPGADGQREALRDLGQSVGTLTGVDPCEAVVDAAGPAQEREALDVAEGDHVRSALPLRPPVPPQLAHQ